MSILFFVFIDNIYLCIVKMQHFVVLLASNKRTLINNNEYEKSYRIIGSHDQP